MLITFAISLFSLCLFCIHEFIVVNGLVSLPDNFKEYFSVKDIVKLIIQNSLIYLVSVIWIYLIYYFKLNEKSMYNQLLYYQL